MVCLPCRLFVVWSASGDMRGPSIIFEEFNVPCPGPLHFSHIADYVYDFYPLLDPDVGPPVLVRDVEHVGVLYSRYFLSEMVSPCLTPILILIFSLSLRNGTAADLSVGNSTLACFQFTDLSLTHDAIY